MLPAFVIKFKDAPYRSRYAYNKTQFKYFKLHRWARNSNSVREISPIPTAPVSYIPTGRRSVRR